jgi:hypothetical protein
MKNQFEKQNQGGEMYKREEKIKELTGEQYSRDFEEIEDLLKTSAIIRSKVIEALKEEQKIKDKLFDVAEIGQSIPEELKERIAELKGVAGASLMERSQEEATTRVINEFAEKYGLEVQFSVNNTSDEISQGLEKAFNAKLWELTNNIEA